MEKMMTTFTAHARKSGIKMRTGVLAALLSITLSTNALSADLPEWWNDWAKRTEASRKTINDMTTSANKLDADIAYNEFLEYFDEDVKIHGLTDSTVGKETVKEHYYPVFHILNLVLVNDALIAVGDQVMERYHAWRSFDAETGTLQFDNCEFKPKSGAFSIRGYTLFNIREGKIVERFSNHDHGYRFQQTCGKADKGNAIKASLSGGFENDNEVYQWGLTQLDNMSKINLSMEDRLALATDSFAKDAEILGVGPKPASIKELKQYLKTLWSAFPDLIYHQNGAATAWGRLAINYQAAGSHRGEWYGDKATHQAILLKGEMILQFNQEGKIIKASIYDKLDQL